MSEQQDYRPFEHLTTPRASVYRAVMGAFVQAKRRFTVHLRPEDVHAALAGADTAEDLNGRAGQPHWLGQPAGGSRHQPGHHGRGLPPRPVPLPADPGG